MNELTRATQPQFAAICDSLTVSALGIVGKRILRADRSRHALWCEPSYATVYLHQTWTISEREVNRSLREAWADAPWLFRVHAHLGNDTASLAVYTVEHYVYDLIRTKTPHRLEVLLFRLAKAGLDLEVPQDINPAITLDLIPADDGTSDDAASARLAV